MRKLDVADRWRLDADELSGLGLRRHGPASAPELLVVGDSGFRVLTSGLTEHDPRGRSPKLDDQVDRFTTGRSSQWEGVTADGSGRVFILQEHPGHVFVLSLEFGRLDEALQLDVPGRHAEWERSWHEDKNARGEALLLMRGGHVLVFKQRDPVALIEFGPKHDASIDLRGDPFLPADETFAVSDQPLHPVRSWELDAPLESISDVSRVGGQIFILSAKSRCIAALGPLGDDAKPVGLVGEPWALPDDIAQPEGLVVLDEESTPIVAADLPAGDGRDNLFRLTALAR
jgi:uncharacterized protein YjiK